MADVTDRGQIILITGFALAVTLVAVILLLNTVIYTENIATRGTDSGPGEALEFRDATIDGVGDLIIATNHEGYANQGTLESDLQQSINNLTTILRAQHIDRGTIAYLNNSTVSTTDGVLLQQSNDTRSYLSARGNTTWTLASAVTHTRRVRFVVDESQLQSESLASLLGSDVFQLRLTDNNSNTWTAYLYNGPDDITLATSVDGSNEDEHCSASGPNATIDFTGSGIVGETCSGYDWAEGLTGEYTIEILHGDHASGTYNFTVRTERSAVSINSSNFNSLGSSDPVALEAAYSTSVTIHYESGSMVYETTIRAAPGEDNDE